MYAVGVQVGVMVESKQWQLRPSSRKPVANHSRVGARFLYMTMIVSAVLVMVVLPQSRSADSSHQLT